MMLYGTCRDCEPNPETTVVLGPNELPPDKLEQEPSHEGLMQVFADGIFPKPDRLVE